MRQIATITWTEGKTSRWMRPLNPDTGLPREPLFRLLDDFDRPKNAIPPRSLAWLQRLVAGDERVASFNVHDEYQEVV